MRENPVQRWSLCVQWLCEVMLFVLLLLYGTLGSATADILDTDTGIISKGIVRSCCAVNYNVDIGVKFITFSFCCKQRHLYYSFRRNELYYNGYAYVLGRYSLYLFNIKDDELVLFLMDTGREGSVCVFRCIGSAVSIEKVYAGTPVSLNVFSMSWGRFLRREAMV